MVDPPATALFADIRRIAGLRARAMQLMNGLDFLILPTVPVLPYPAEAVGDDADDFFSSWSNTMMFNITEQPALNVPCGFSSGGLPIGLQLVGPRFADQDVLAMGSASIQALRGTEADSAETPWTLLE